MKNNKKRVKLIVNLIYSVIFCIVGFFAVVVLTILPFVAFSPTSKIIEIIWVVVGSIFAIIFLIGAISSYQTAILNEMGITFRVAIWQIAKISWNDVVKVDIQNLTTLHSTIRSFGVDWIILYTSNNQQSKHGGGNARNKTPWQIKYNKKNAKILVDFCTKYRPDLNILQLIKKTTQHSNMK